jgi:hypothetical protein
VAIQPIDLQTLFTQVEKVGKEQANLRDGLQLQQALQGARMQQKTEERIQSVNESQDLGQGPEKVKDRSARKRRNDRPDASVDEAELPGEPQPKDPSVIQDPALGKNVDLSG